MGTRRGSRAHGALMVMMAIATTGALVRAAGLTTKYDAELQRLRPSGRPRGRPRASIPCAAPRPSTPRTRRRN